MDPSQNSADQQNVPLQQETSTEQQVAQSAQTVVQAMQPPMASQQPVMGSVSSPQPARSSKLPLVLGSIIGAFLLLAGGLVVLYMLVLSPAAQSKKASNTFMTAASKGDAEKLYVLDDATDESSKSFLKNTADSLKGSYKLTDHTSKDGKWYYAYSVENAKSKYARTIVEKKSGKWIVSSIVYGANQLSLVPGETKSVDTTTTPTPTSTATTVANICLAQDDYKYMNYDKKPDSVTYDSTYDSTKYTSNKVADMYFKPDSIEETSLSSIYDDWADFATHNSTKTWKFRLRGTVNLSGSNSLANADAVKLSNQRSAEVKRELMARGVPDSKIVIDDPINNSDEYIASHNVTTGAQVDNSEIYRRVELTVDPSCTGSATTTTTGK